MCNDNKYIELQQAKLKLSKNFQLLRLFDLVRKKIRLVNFVFTERYFRCPSMLRKWIVNSKQNRVHQDILGNMFDLQFRITALKFIQHVIIRIRQRLPFDAIASKRKFSRLESHMRDRLTSYCFTGCICTPL